MRAAQAFAKLWHLQLYADSQLVREWKKKRRRLPGDSDDINNSSLLCPRLAITARVGERARKRGKEREEGREHVVRAALQSESESEQRNLLHCLGSIATPLPLRSVCLSNNLAAVWGRHCARGEV